MSIIHIHHGKNNLNLPLKETKVQYMPFTINADTDANVSDYFDKNVQPKSSTTPYERASFRGHPLLGEKMNLPEGYEGIVLHETMKPISDKENRKFHVVNVFNSFTYWNWDQIPTENDAVVRALNDWIHIAEALHSPALMEE